jgi:hypothetical protein
MANLRNNLRAVARPAVTDDAGDGYAIGSLWFYDNVLWRCSDASAGAAVWSTVPVGFRLLANGKSSSHTGGTSESSALATISLPPVGPKGAVKVSLVTKFTGTAGTKTIRLKLDGSSFMAAASVAGSLSGDLQHYIFADNSETAQFSEQTSSDGPGAFSGNAVQTFTKGWTVPLDLTITGQLGSAADSIDWVYYMVEHMHAR